MERVSGIVGVMAAVGLPAVVVTSSCHPIAALTPPSNPREIVYEMRVLLGGSKLEIDASFPAARSADIAAVRGTQPFVHDVRVAVDGGWRDVAQTTNGWTVPGCEIHGCSLHYTVDLDGAARTLDGYNSALRSADSLLASPRAWLLAPEQPGASTFSIVVAGPSLPFRSGMAPEQDNVFRGVLPLPHTPMFSFGHDDAFTVEADRARIEVVVTDRSFEGRVPLLREWVTSNASLIAGHFGHYPVPRTMLVIESTEGDVVESGTTFGGQGSTILVHVGTGVSKASLDNDWVLPHEMAHLGLPDLEETHHWLEEGLATYIEHLTRARAGRVDTKKTWSSLIDGMRKGLPRRVAQGLDGTRDWGRTYWGGALFCLVADLEIRKRTGGARTLDDGFRAVLHAGGDIRVRWPIAQVLAVADKATGTTVLADLYASWATTPQMVDLPSMWRDLGLVLEKGRVVDFDENAPLAPVRRALTTAR